MFVAQAISDHVLRMTGIGKSFPGVRALNEVTFTVERGEVHGLVGENGAGKSTLMKILSGAYRADAGTVEVDGRLVEHATPAMMIERGIAVIYQEFAQANHLTVAENLFLGRLKQRRGMVDWPRMRADARRLLGDLGCDIDPNALTGDLSVAKRQMVEIARAISREARLIVLDEPTAVLGDAEVEALFAAIRRLQVHGVSFIYISHRLKEIFDICQTATVLRDGQVVASRAVSDWTTPDLIQAMVGRPMGEQFPSRKPQIGAPVLSVDGLRREGVLHDIGFHVRKGEILGICGLAGAGRTEVLRAIVGADPIDTGRVLLEGAELKPSPSRMLASGVGFVPEERKLQALFLDQGVDFNVVASAMHRITRAGVLSGAEEARKVDRFISMFNVKTPSRRQRIGLLSGGNQQKCIIARQLHAEARVLLIDEPTRGVDVGAKREIYEILIRLTEEQGLAIVMVSSELPEIVGLCDRVLVMREGRITAELRRGETLSVEEIMHHATVH